MAGLGGLVLLAIMFLDWYGVEGGTGNASAWQAFAVVDVFLAILAAFAIGLAVVTAVERAAAIPIAVASLGAWFGLFAIVLVLWRIAFPVDVGWVALVALGGGEPEATRELGLWLGLVATLVTTLGLFASMRDERFPKAARIDVPVETIPPPEGGRA